MALSCYCLPFLVPVHFIPSRGNTKSLQTGLPGWATKRTWLLNATSPRSSSLSVLLLSIWGSTRHVLAGYHTIHFLYLERYPHQDFSASRQSFNNEFITFNFSQTDSLWSISQSVGIACCFALVISFCFCWSIRRCHPLPQHDSPLRVTAPLFCVSASCLDRIFVWNPFESSRCYFILVGLVPTC